MTETPRSLLQRLRRAPDQPSWNRLIALYTPFLRQALRCQGLPESDADDLMQEVFTVIASEIGTFEHSGRTGAFRQWVRNILLHRVRRYWRTRQRWPASADGEAIQLDAMEDPENDLARFWEREHNQWITRRLLELIEPEFQATTWQAFHRQVIQEVAPRQVAAELGLTVNAVLIAKSRVLRRLRQEIDGLTD